MRTLILGNAAGVGGAQTAFRQFAEFLIADGVDVALLVLGDGTVGLPRDLENAVLSRIPFAAEVLSQKLAKGTYTLRAAWAARRFAPDVFVSVGLGGVANVIARSLHGSCFKIAQDFHFRSINDPLLVAASKVFDAIGVQSQSMVTSLWDAGFRARPVNWVPCLPVPPVEGYGRKVRACAGIVRLAYFGRLVENKGLDLLLEALSGADLEAPIKLDVWGTGPETKRLIALRDRLGLTESVEFLGRYPVGTGGARLMCEYDAMVLPSTASEGLPLILLEAMAYGLPFLATDTGAMRDCCDRNADSILVSPKIEDLRQGLREVVRKLVAQEFQPERLRAYYDRHFSYTLMLDRWRQCLRSPAAFFNATE